MLFTCCDPIECSHCGAVRIHIKRQHIMCLLEQWSRERHPPVLVQEKAGVCVHIDWEKKREKSYITAISFISFNGLDLV